MSSLATANTGNLPALTVVTVVFNGREEIARTMDSVLGQDYPNIEYIVIDGESTDGTGNVIRQYEDRLDVSVCEPDEGVYDAMNKALRRATGEFILFMNCGDVFAGADAVTSAMRFAKPGEDQILFGHWLRRVGENSLLHCHPVIGKGLFNHQAVIYSRHIHAWHGEYVSVKGLTAADYLFFATLFDSASVTCRIIEATIAIIDINGISAGMQTLAQKNAIDFICGRAGKMKLLAILAVHPVYRRIKVLLGKGRR